MDNEATIIDIDEIYSNDIYAILKTYGVEMARAAILHEINVVFKAYNIDVDRRHLELIADYMVRFAHQVEIVLITVDV
jgi:DNA-directed RNA polymerase I subunit RPA1